jgi:hypothetical protein
MPIASIGSILRVTPGDELQIVHAKGEHEFVDDRFPFRVKVSQFIYEHEILIGVSGPVIDGHPRYQGFMATLLTRLDDSHWELDVRSAANFKIGATVARRIIGIPHGHPDGTVIDSFPYIVRYGSIASET